MIPIEIVGTIIKPVALALRLFANMTAGHILVAVLFMFAISGLSLLIGETVQNGEVVHQFSPGTGIIGLLHLGRLDRGSHRRLLP